jgi:hypothetical protein
MPEISRFFGIVITMYYLDHDPPHFHVRYGEQKAVISIETLALLYGRLSPRVLGLLMEWAATNQSKLAENWGLAQQNRPLVPIEPLE